MNGTTPAYKAGLTALLSGGTMCGAGVARSTTLKLVCDRTVTVLNATMDITEPSICAYEATIRYAGFCPLACPPGRYGTSW